MDLSDNIISNYSLDPNIARNLSHSTIIPPIMEAITPRWFLAFLPWVSVDAGVYRVNQVRKINDVTSMEVCDYPERVYRG
jgi:hypothetical protein